MFGRYRCLWLWSLLPDPSQFCLTFRPMSDHETILSPSLGDTETSICYCCAEPATQMLTLPTVGWGADYARALQFEAPACDAHASPLADESQLVAEILRLGQVKSAKLPLDQVKALEAYIAQLAYANFYGIFGKPWGQPLLVLIPKLSISPLHRPLAQELEEELRAEIKESFPEAGPYKLLDYQFFETESEQDEDNVLWVRFPAGLEAFVLLASIMDE